METVGAYEAKTHLARLLDRVARGESRTIARHGKPVARLVPAADDRDRAKEAAARIIERRKHIRPISSGCVPTRGVGTAALPGCRRASKAQAAAGRQRVAIVISG